MTGVQTCALPIFVSWRDDGSSGCTVELCKRIMHHATYFPTRQVDAPHSGCLVFWQTTARRGAPSSCPIAPCTMLCPLPVDASSLGGMTARRGALSSCAIATCTMHHAPCTMLCPPPVDASSLGGMTARRGAPSSCANASCTTLHIFPLCRWMPRIQDAGSRPAGATPVLSHRGNAICFTHSASGCPVSWRDDGSLGCTVELCNMQHHHAT